MRFIFENSPLCGAHNIDVAKLASHWSQRAITTIYDVIKSTFPPMNFSANELSVHGYRPNWKIWLDVFHLSFKDRVVLSLFFLFV